MTKFNMQNSITEGVEMQNGTQAVRRLLQAAGFLSGFGFDVCVAVSAPSCVQFWASDMWKEDLKNIMRQATNSQADLREENMDLDMLVEMASDSRASCSTQTASPPEFDSLNKIVSTENEITGSHVIVEEFIKVELTSNDGIKEEAEDCIDIPDEGCTTENIQCITSKAEVGGFPQQNVPSPKGVKNKDGLLCCELCNFKCKYPKKMEIHARVHTGERPFKCDVCGVGRTQASHLREHMRIHTGEKPYACEFCEYRSSQSSSMRLHKLRNHIQNSGTLKSPLKSRQSLRRRGNAWHIKPAHNS